MYGSFQNIHTLKIFTALLCTHTPWMWRYIISPPEKDLASRWHCGTYLGNREFAPPQAPAVSPALPGSELQEPHREAELSLLRFGCSNYKMSTAFHLILHSRIMTLIYLTHRYVYVHGGGGGVISTSAFSSFTYRHSHLSCHLKLKRSQLYTSLWLSPLSLPLFRQLD